jgi:hypothetical protein
MSPVRDTLRASAELTAVRDADVLDAGHRDHPNLGAVLLAEERHGAQGLGLLERQDLPRHFRIAQRPLRHPALDSRELLGGRRFEVRVVEAESVRRHQRAGLAHVGAENVTQGGMQHVSRGVMALGRQPVRGIDAGLEPALLSSAEPAVAVAFEAQAVHNVIGFAKHMAHRGHHPPSTSRRPWSATCPPDSA